MDFPNLDFEKKLWKKGLKYVGGIDEVGRGSLAGPVVASCVVFNPTIFWSVTELPIRIADSKKLTYKQRASASVWIKKNSLTWGIGKAPVALVNKIGISKATQTAMRSAVRIASKKLKTGKMEYLLLDAFYLPYIYGLPKGKNRKIVGVKNKKEGFYLLSDIRSKQLAIINGDEKSVSIAAASIIAKVYRDTLMERVGSYKPYRKYDWINNKGYGSKKHLEAIIKYGKTKYHRELYVNTFLKNSI